MGDAIYKDEFTESEFREFKVRLESQVGELRSIVTEPAFQLDKPSFGAELELYLVDDEYRPAAVNEELLELSGNPQLTPELNRYNLEFNLSPVAAAGSPFRLMERELRGFMDDLQAQAQSIGANIIPIGILPTLQQAHLSPVYMTDRPRYHALSKGLCRLRGGGFDININGKDPLSLRGEGVTVEGANTSFQVHLRVPANRFANCFNAAQMTTPLALAMAANSPLIAGHRLWQESRIALFKQSIDSRERHNTDWRQPARVNFGNGWVRNSAWELFAEDVALYPPLMPLLFEDTAAAAPVLPELCLHHGTIWPWNRAVYASEDGGHLRIEFRTLPAGPTVIDMIANAAFCIGLTIGLRDSVDEYIARLPFKFAEYNFYRAGQYGLDAHLIWPRKHGSGLEERSVAELIEEFMPRARQGLQQLGVDDADSNRLWQVLENRLATRQTGAAWQLQEFERYRQSESVERACSRMLADYVQRVMAGSPVASWC